MCSYVLFSIPKIGDMCLLPLFFSFNRGFSSLLTLLNKATLGFPDSSIIIMFVLYYVLFLFFLL